MNTPTLTVLGRGAVTPSGWGMPPGAEVSPVEPGPLISDPRTTFPSRRVRHTGPLWERWKSEPRLRRASPISRHLAQAVGSAMEGADPGIKRGLIGIFSTGALVFSRKFYQGCLSQGRALASPALFPETVYNSPLSHTAAIFGFGGPAYSLVGDESTWAEACATAALWIQLGTVDEVVVVAAEEWDPIVMEALHAAGWLRPHRGYLPSEGASAVRLAATGGNGPQLKVTVRPVPFIDPRDARAAAGRVMDAVPREGRVLPSAHGLWSERLEREMLNGREGEAPDPAVLGLGRCFAAGWGWTLLDALQRLGPAIPRIHLPIFGGNQAVAALTVF